MNQPETSSKNHRQFFQDFKATIRYWAAVAWPFRWYFFGIYLFYTIGITAEFIIIPIY